MTKHLRLFMLMLLALVCMGGYSAVGDTYKLVTSVDELKAGDVIVIGCKTNKTALGTAANGKTRRQAVSVTISGANILTYAEGIDELTLEGIKDAWYFKSSSGTDKYLSAEDNNTNLNYLTKSGAKQATISIESGVTLIKFTSVASNRAIKQNGKSGYGFYSATASNYQAVQIYKKQASDKQDPGIKFKDLNRVTISLYTLETNNYIYPSATINDWIENSNDLPITYESSDESIAKIDTEGNILMYKGGEVTFTAHFAGNETYKAADATITLTLNITDDRQDPGFAFKFDRNVTISFYELKSNNYLYHSTIEDWIENPNNRPVTYESSDESIAKIDDEGKIYLYKEGAVTITAHVKGDKTYKSVDVTMALTITDSDIFYESFDKYNGDGGNKGGFKPTGTTDYKEALNDNKGWTTNSALCAYQCIKVGTGSTKGSVTTPTIKVSKKAKLTFRAAAWDNKSENTQIEISITNGNLTAEDNQTAQAVTIDLKKAEWTDYSMIISGASEFTLTFAAKQDSKNRFFLDEVKVTEIPSKDFDFAEENTDNAIEDNDNANVMITRHLVADGGWNTLCLPFSLTAEQIKGDEAFGADAELREIDTDNSNGNTIVFKEATSITAGVPYLIKGTKFYSEGIYIFEGVILSGDAPKAITAGDGIVFTGLYNATEVSTIKKEGNKVAALGEKNQLFNVTSGAIKGFRAYFLLPEAAQTQAIKVVIDGTATGIGDLQIDGTRDNGRVYNLAGQCVGTSLDSLKAGVYIQNGKKVIKK